MSLRFPFRLRSALLVSLVLLLTATTRSSHAGGDDFHADFDALLRVNVGAGLVFYPGFDTPRFEDYLAKLAAAQPEAWPRSEKLAFWINAYNACAIRQVLDNSTLSQPIDKADFFKEKKFSVAGRMLSLDQIENEVIRPHFREALIHFGLVCAARGCPPLLNTAYTAGSVMELLKSNLRSYLAGSAGMRVDRAANTIYLSRIFDWYRVDFGESDSKVIDYIASYADAQTAAWIKQNRSALKLAFLDYDWTVNRRPAKP